MKINIFVLIAAAFLLGACSSQESDESISASPNYSKTLTELEEFNRSLHPSVVPVETRSIWGFFKKVANFV